MKIAVFWVVAPCSLVEIYPLVRPVSLHWMTDPYITTRFLSPGLLIALMMEAARTSEMLVNFYQTTRCYNPEDSNLEYSVMKYSIKECHYNVQYYTVLLF
jgi:hypothetical protein